MKILYTLWRSSLQSWRWCQAVSLLLNPPRQCLNLLLISPSYGWRNQIPHLQRGSSATRSVELLKNGPFSRKHTVNLIWNIIRWWNSNVIHEEEKKFIQNFDEMNFDQVTAWQMWHSHSQAGNDGILAEIGCWKFSIWAWWPCWGGGMMGQFASPGGLNYQSANSTNIEGM